MRMPIPSDSPPAATLERRLSRRLALECIAGGAFAVVAGIDTIHSAAAAPQGVLMNQATPTSGDPLTVVLVHGAFTDGSSWAGVVQRLLLAGNTVMAPANPLRGVGSDAAYIASVVSQIPGPVVLVGHSYGGVVIANAAPLASNVVGLVFINAFIPDEGETLQGLSTQATDSLLGPALRPAQFPTGIGQEPGTEFSVDPASFHEVFAADLSASDAAVLAASQRPASALAFGEPSGPVGWKSLPAWAMVSPSDWAIGPAGERFMAERSGADIVEVDASHLVMLSQPQAVTDLVATAITALSQASGD